MNITPLKIKEDLPTNLLTISGDSYDPNMDTWSFTDGTRKYNFRFDPLKPAFSYSLILSIKKTLSSILSKFLINTAMNKYYSLKKLSIYLLEQNKKISEFTSHDIINFIGQNNNNVISKDLKVFLNHMHSLKLNGIGEDVLTTLHKMHIPSQSSGLAIKTCDPRKGPYTELEYQNLCDDIHEKYGQKIIDGKTYLFSLLFNLLAIRTRQVAWLKICDLKIKFHADKKIKYVLNVPRDKQGHVEPRVEFTERPLTIEMGELIEDHIETIKNEYYLQNFNEEYDVNQLPLFPSWKNNTHFILKYHCYIYEIEQINRKLSNKIEVLSRTGEKLKIFPRRARYYKGTNLAINGCSANIIACALDHSSLQSCKSYIQLGQEAIQAIDSGVAQYHTPLIKAFKGEIFKRPNILGAIKTYDPIQAAESAETMGACIKPGGCGVYVSESTDPKTFLSRIPFSCYRCINFNAFDDIEIHKSHLEMLEKERNMHLRLFNTKGSATQTIIAQSYDPIICAIKEVINKIKCNDISSYDLEDELVDSW